MTNPPGCWSCTGGMACADAAKARTKTTAIHLIIAFLPFVVVWRQATMRNFVSGLSVIDNDRRLELR
jgi:hypothetical protein